MKYRILHIEDENVLGRLVYDALTKSGFDVLLVGNGHDALQAFKQFEPHLCLFDIMLPGKSGYDVARQVRALDSKIPIIFLSAKVQVNDIVEGFNTGCNDYIRKPFSMDELLVRINSWLVEKYGKPSETEDEYTAGAYRFSPKQQLLTTPSGDIELSFKESMILNVLFAHRNQVVSRNFLLQKVWDSETIYNSRSLDVYINKLRKYLVNSPSRILTLKGVGYKFITE